MQVHPNEYKSSVSASMTVPKTDGSGHEIVVLLETRRLDTPSQWNAADFALAEHVMKAVYGAFPDDLAPTLGVPHTYGNGPLHDWGLFFGVILAVRFCYSRQGPRPTKFHRPRDGLYAEFSNGQWVVTVAPLAMQMTCDAAASTQSLSFEFSRAWYESMARITGNAPGVVVEGLGIGEAPPLSPPFWTKPVLAKEYLSPLEGGFDTRTWSRLSDLI